ncbi:GlxA family transcriptional regulator [Marinobacterium jannaschii]|uniref:GlxA family transcriptional regulator n=1 Tax=Marinobacterium jannaschii TaxID=64970 RepID=UPI00055BB3F6|nr:helix-turn-helix domain-containing protein [Marinobacterium jannaschii]
MKQKAIRVLFLAVPETAGSSLYGMLDVLAAAGNVWQTLVRSEPLPALFTPQIVSLERQAFKCGNNIPVLPDHSIADCPGSDILIIPELWLGPDENLHGRYPQLMQFIRDQYEQGCYLYSACSGSLLLAESGLLNGRRATSHWGYEQLFRAQYPDVDFQPEPILCFADDSGRVVTAGGTSSWHDLVIHIISRHGSPAEAMRISKVYLLKWHDEGQLPYKPLVNQTLHSDAQISEAERWLEEHYLRHDAIDSLIGYLDIPERTLKRRFKAITGESLLERIQNLRVENAKRALEGSHCSIDEISADNGYEDAGFFRRLFKRLTGLSPSQYRKMFGRGDR